jgi:hypothetical protein
MRRHFLRMGEEGLPLRNDEGGNPQSKSSLSRKKTFFLLSFPLSLITTSHSETRELFK